MTSSAVAAGGAWGALSPVSGPAEDGHSDLRVVTSASVSVTLSIIPHRQSHRLYTCRYVTIGNPLLDCCSRPVGDSLRGGGAHTEAAGNRQVIRCIDVAAQTRPRPGEFHRARAAVPSGRVPSERRLQQAPECEQGGRPAAVAIGDEAAFVDACRFDCLG